MIVATMPSSADTAKGILPTAITWLASLSGVVLSIVALLNICDSCSETANYRVFGLDFGWFGIGYFSLLTLTLALRRKFHHCARIALLLAFAAAGAEARFIWIQKYDIGQWCPICLCLAAAVFFICIGTAWERLRHLTAKGATMKSKLVFLVLVSLFFVMGLGAAIAGVKKEADNAEQDLFLGRRSSPTTVYFVSDWFCPACRKAEPVIEKMYPELARSVRIGFVDFPIHRETTNFTPYNLQFLTFEKAKYISLRRALSDLSLKTRTPTEAEVRAAIAPLGVRLRPLDYSETLYGMQSNLTVYRGFDVHSTPTVVVTNARTKKSKLLVGDGQINLPAVRAAIAEVERK
jgi:protein-disulfide isomerase